MVAVMIERLERRAVTIDFQSIDSDSSEATRLFDKAAGAIQAEWRVRQKTFGRRRDLGWLEVTCYALLVQMLNLDLAGLFDERIRQHGRYSKGSRGNPNCFQTGLMALFADDAECLGARDRERMGKRMWRAYRHYVPPVFLLGFLEQQRSGASELEPGFAAWIAERRWCERDDSGARGTYPAAIEEAVQRRERIRERHRHQDTDDWD